jgi:DNA repair protein RadD
MLTLRPYQEDAKAAVYTHLRMRNDNPCVVIPTAGGKTPVMASICQDAVNLWNGRVLILAHVKELLEQSADKLNSICPEIEFGIYSAGLNRRDANAPVIVAGIQTVYKRARELNVFDLAIVDEAHMIPAEGDGMYRQFLKDAYIVNPNLRIIGFTATPFRLKSGPICTPDGVLNDICFQVGVRELIRDNFLCPVITKAGISKAQTDTLHVRDGDYVANEVEDLMDQHQLVEGACRELASYTHDRHVVLIFASGIKHGRHLVRTLQNQHNIACGFVTGETSKADRRELLTRFRHGQLKYLCNVGVLTTGFDAPNIDCVAIVRPTMSPGLYYQMVGRGFRVHPGKQNCLVLDFGGNVLRHGPVDQIQHSGIEFFRHGKAPAKECPICHTVMAAGYARCQDCGFEFPQPVRQKHVVNATEAMILSSQITTTTYAVRDVFYSVHTKRDAAEDAPRSMRVEYKIGFHKYKSEWICFEHKGYARAKAVAWWTQRSRDGVPDTAQEAVDLASTGGLAVPTSITVRTFAGDEFERIIHYELGPLPEAPATPEPNEDKEFDLDEIRF